MEEGRWESPAPGRLERSAGHLRMSLAWYGGEAEGKPSRLQVRAAVLHPVAVHWCAQTLVSECDHPPFFLDRFLRWRKLIGTERHGELMPLVISWGTEGSSFDLRGISGALAAELEWRAPTLSLRLIMDAAALHPRWSFQTGVPTSTAAPVSEVGTEFSVALHVRSTRVRPAEPRPVTSRYPAGAEAAFVVTDHCDFDTVENLRAFIDGSSGRSGWVGRSLRLTKGVFTITRAKAGRQPAPTLEDKEYDALTQRLHDDGSEIAAHALHESGPLARTEFDRALAIISRRYCSRTWIDHGLSLDYCYTMGGAERGGYNLVKELRARGFTTMWAYHDAIADPVTSLNQLHLWGCRCRHEARSRTRHARSRLGCRSLRAYRFAVRRRGSTGEALGRALSEFRALYMASREASDGPAAGLRRIRTSAEQILRRRAPSPVLPYRTEDVSDFSPTVYPERATPLRQSLAGELMLFATLETTHPSDAYTGRALAQLRRERGLHIGHCYLLNRLPYLAGIFEPGSHAPALREQWLIFLDELEAVVRERAVWNPTVAGLTEWLRDWHRIDVEILGERRCRITNPLHRPVDDFTLLLPRSTDPHSCHWGTGGPGGWRPWCDWNAVWGQVPAAGSVIVGW